MQYIQDRERIVKRILKGKGTVGNDTPIMSAHGPDFCSELPQREFDPDKAKFHFNKSGVKQRGTLFVAPVMSGIEDACLLAQANCAKIGFDLQLKKVPTDGYWGAVWMKEPLNVVTWNMRPTAQLAAGDPVRAGRRLERHVLEQRAYGRAAEGLARPSRIRSNAMRCTAKCRPWSTMAAAW